MRRFRACFSSKRAMTLSELLVSTVLMGIVMVGVAGFTSSIRQVQSSSSHSAQLALQTTAAMILLAKDAEQATGDATDPGIIWSNTLNRICFRQDVNQTPMDYTDDTWACWAHGNSHHLYRCELDTPLSPGGYCPSSKRIFMANLGQYGFFEVHESSGSIDSITLDLFTIHDQTSSAHPMENPTFRISSTANPVSHGR